MIDDILTFRFDSDISLVVLSNVPGFCRTFNCENQTINKHFTGTFVNRFLVHTWRTIVFIQPGVQDMSIIICAYKVAVK